MKIEISDSLKKWIEQETEWGGFESPTAFVESVLHSVKTRNGERIANALRESLASGDPIPVTPEFWEQRRRELEEYIKTLGKAAG